ncbi:unnamed protein product [Staurois parvus]|uniref:Uncharacterized protein n=1 Tax=Staurois parvus TaxID=386267 RepID=A0ABN9D724_9NEOB|nr:unnamed protein product [Staurois parvus]
MLPHLDACNQRKCEKLVLSLYCNSLSVPFQEPVSPLEDSEVAEAGRNLEVIFEDLLKEAYPGRLFPFPQEDDSESEEIGAENCHMKGFHWPSYGAECPQPKRRRRHTISQKAKDFSLC